MNRKLYVGLVVSLILVCLAGCGIVASEKPKYIGIEKPGFTPDYQELVDTIMDEINVDDYKYSETTYSKTGALSQRWVIDVSDEKESDLNKFSAHPCKNGWVLYNGYRGTTTLIDPLDANNKTENPDKFTDIRPAYLGEEKTGFTMVKPIINVFDSYLFYHIGYNTYIYNTETKDLLYVMANIRITRTKFFVYEDKLYLVNGLDDIREYSVIDLKDGSTATIDNVKPHDSIYNISGNIWIKTRDNNLIKIDTENNTFSNIIMSLDGTESVFEDVLAKLFDAEQYGDYILGCTYTPLEHEYDDRWFHRGAHFNRFVEYNDKYIPKTIQTYFLMNPEHWKIYHLDETVLGQMDARVNVVGSHFIIENDDVLKCIDPFKFEKKEIWWIDRSDVGDDATILWADERGVLVYSFSNQKLYCFE